MDPADAAEAISDAAEEGDGDAQGKADRLRDLAAIVIAVIAAILAIGGLGGGNATDDLVANNIKSSDTWNFYQAKNVRQTQYELAADALKLKLSSPVLSAAERTVATQQLAHYDATIKRYESEPDPAAPNDPTRGEGKAQLKARAQAYAAAFDRASDQDGNFDYAGTALQLALVLGSVSILAKSRAMLIGALALGALGTLLTVNGFLLLFPLPF